MVFFCQAEDGIRDLVRSRGLGDVYKRQVIGTASDSRTFSVEISNSFDNCVAFDGITIPSGSLSLIHI